MSSDPPVPPQIPGDMGQLTLTQSNFAAIADAAGRIGAQLQNAGGQIVWSGAAHDAFESVLKDVPYDLQKIQTSFGLAAVALQDYLSQVPDLQSSYSSTLRQFLPVWERQQQLMGQLSNVTPGFFSIGGPSTQQQQQEHSLQSQIEANQPELERLYRTLVDLFTEAEQAAANLAGALAYASDQGIKDSFSTAWHRYSGDVTGFVSGVVEGIAHDVEELAAAVGNLAETLVKMADDIAHGNWSAVAKDAEQALLDVNDICRSISNLLLTLTPILALIPGLDVVVGILDVVALVATALTVETDLEMTALGGTAVDPLSGQQVDLRQQGEQSLVGDTLNLVFSVLPGGGGVADDMASDAGADFIREGQDLADVKLVTADGTTEVLSTVSEADRFQTSMGAAFEKFAEENPGTELSDQVTAIDKMYDTKAVSSFSDILHYRQALADSATRVRGLWEANPEVFNQLGVKLSFRQFRMISAGVRGGTLGWKAEAYASHPDPQGADDATAAGASALSGALQW